MSEHLMAVLASIEQQDHNLTHHDIARQLGQAIDNATGLSDDEIRDLRRDYLAFSFSQGRDNDANWGTFFGPHHAWIMQDGGRHEWPTLEMVDQVTLAYWSDRAQQSPNALMRARYADLAWDLSKPSTSATPDYHMAQVAAHAYIECVNRDMCAHPTEAIEQVQRALSLGLGIRDEAIQKDAIAAMVSLEDRVAKDPFPGLWGFSFEALVGNRKLAIDDALAAKLLSDLEGRLDRLAREKSTDPGAIESAAELLANHYRRLGKADEMARVLRTYAHGIEAFARMAGPAVGSIWLTKVHERLAAAGLRMDTDRTAKTIQDLDSVSEMGSELEMRMEVPADQINALLAEVETGDLQSAILRVVSAFLLDRSALEDSVRHLATESPLHALIKISIKDAENRTVAQVGPLAEDLEGRIVLQAMQDLQVWSPILRQAFIGLWKNPAMSLDAVIEFLAGSPAFPEGRRGILRRGIQAWADGDAAVAVCVLIPEIEAGLRRLLREVGGALYRLSKHDRGSFDLKNMREVLDDPLIENVLPDYIRFYLRVAFVDRRGWNLRNYVCHGQYEARALDMAKADRVCHAILLLGCIRTAQSKQEGATATE